MAKSANPHNTVNMLQQQNANKSAVYIGKVLEDKQANSHQIKVLIPDLMPFYSGELKPKEESYNVGGGNFSGNIKARNYWIATWHGMNSNRRFPPDVKAGEQVKVTVFADGSTAYWESLGRNDDLRRTERLEFNAADTPDQPQEINKENSYSLSIDTQDKKEFTIQTSKTGGEPFMYTIKINAKDGILHLSDDSNNELTIESATPRVYMRNRDGSMIELAQKKITISAPEDFMLKAGRQAVFDIPTLYFRNSQGSGCAVWEFSECAFKGKSLIVQANCIGLQGNVEATNIVSGAHYATSYSTIAGPTRKRSMLRSTGGMQKVTTSSNVGGGGATGAGYQSYNAPSIGLGELFALLPVPVPKPIDGAL